MQRGGGVVKATKQENISLHIMLPVIFAGPDVKPLHGTIMAGKPLRLSSIFCVHGICSGTSHMYISWYCFDCP